jgi:hypothetical protein
MSQSRKPSYPFIPLLLIYICNFFLVVVAIEFREVKSYCAYLELGGGKLHIHVIVLNACSMIWPDRVLRYLVSKSKFGISYLYIFPCVLYDPSG